MRYDPFKHRRRSIRLKGCDYSQEGAYYVTIVTRDRKCLFGEIESSETRLNDFGRIVQEEWLKTAQVRPNIELDESLVMPNHFHGIILISDDMVGARRRRAPTETREQFGKPVAGSLPTIIRAFKSATTYRINLLRHSQGAPVWQRNYYEHIIRDEKDLARIREYIINNPANWNADEENPKNSKLL